MSRWLIFLSVLFVVLGGMHAYVFRRAARVWGLGRRAKAALAALFVLGMVLLFGGRAMRGVLPDGWLEAGAVGGTLVVLAVMLATGFLLHVDAFGGLWWVAERLRGRRAEGAPELGATASGATDDGSSSARVMGSGELGSGELGSGELGSGELGSGELGSGDAADATPPPPRDAPTIGAPPVGAPLEPGPAPTLGGRRAFLQRASAGALMVAGGSSGYAALFGRHDYAIDEVPIALPGLPRTLDGYTIAQLSDIHFGTFIGEAELRAAVALVRDAAPDLVVLTGDLLDHDPAYAPMLGRLVRELRPLTRDGVAAIPGNHDHYAGVEEVVDALRRAEAHVLVNGGRLIGDAGGAFGLLGVDDLWARGPGRGPDLGRALAMVPPDVPKVLLAHQPVFFEEAAGQVQLQLSGHTHGGQICFGYNPAEMVVPHGWVRGRYELEGGTLYVNRGFGTAGPPARLFSPPEVTKIVLVSS